MKRFITATLALFSCIFLCSCNKNTQSITDTENTPTSTVAEVQDFQAFFEDMEPADIVISGSGHPNVYYCFGPAGQELAQQYVNAVVSGNYNLILFDMVNNKESNGKILNYYYFKYDGDADVAPIQKDLEWHMYVSSVTYTEENTVIVNADYASGITLVDDGYRADYSKVQKELFPPQPASEITPVPTVKPTSKPTPVSETETVDKNAALIPDFTAFLNRNPSEDKDRYYGGTRKYYQKLPLETQETVISEVLNLLSKPRYQLKLIEKVNAENRIEYNYSYTGNVNMDQIHSKNDDTRYYNLQFTVYNKNNKNGNYGIHFHYAPQFTEENTGYTVSENISNSGSGGGGTVNFEGGDLPDHSKLQCLTCDGDGDCNSCNGKGYKIKDGIKSDCTRCSGGNCPSCGGSGTRS